MDAIRIPDDGDQPRVAQLHRVGKEWKLTTRDDNGGPISIYFTDAHHTAPEDFFHIKYIRRCGSLAIPVPHLGVELVRAVTKKGPAPGTWLFT